jgi:hypothetical protein
MADLSDIADRAQNAINDAGASTWPQAIIEEWVTEAIRDYNSYFRHTVTQNVVMASTGRTVDLSQNTREVLSVEYPRDEDPPQYYPRMNRYHPDFYKNDTNFDFEPVNEWGESVLLEAGTDPHLIFSADIDESETIRVVSRNIHETNLLSGTLVTVPDEHQHLLILFVVWKAHSERTITEAQNPDTSIRLINQMKQAAMMAEQDYRRAIKLAQHNAAEGGWTVPWAADGYDRIY